MKSLLFTLLLSSTTWAAPTAFVYEGYLSSGGAPHTGIVNTSIRILAANCPLYSEEFNGLNVSGGYFNLNITGTAGAPNGVVTANFPAGEASFSNIFRPLVFCDGAPEETGPDASAPRLLEITIDGEVFGTVTLSSAPFAINASMADKSASTMALQGNSVAATAPANGQVLTFNAGTWSPQNAASGTVTNVAAGAGLTGGPITGAGTLSLATSGVTANIYTKVTVDVYGRVTAGAALAVGDIPDLSSLYVVSASLPTCTASEYLRWDGAAWICSTPAGGGGSGTVTSVTANSPLMISGFATISPTVELGIVPEDLGGLGADTASIVGNGEILYRTSPGGILDGISCAAGSAIVYSGGVPVCLPTTSTESNNTIVSRDGSGMSNFYGVRLMGASTGSVQMRVPATGSGWTLTLPDGAGANGQVLTWNAGGTSWVTPSFTVGAGSITTTELADGAVTSLKILDGTITNTDINATAAIADTKLATISTPGKIVGTAITTGNINTNGSFQTSGNITSASQVEGNILYATDSLAIKSAVNASTVQISGPTNAVAGGGYVLTLPWTQPNVGSLLAVTSGGGALSGLDWVNVGANSFVKTDASGILSPTSDIKVNIITNSVSLGNDTMTSGQGDRNTAVGAEALSSATAAADDNVAVGFQTLMNNTTGMMNVAVGASSQSSALGSNNVSVGVNTLYSVSGNDNVAVGYNALNGATTSVGSVAIGSRALINNTAGVNTAIGYNAGYSLVTGGQNTIVGYNALSSSTNGSSNTMIGYNTGRDLPSGSINNIFLGAGTGSNINVPTTNTFLVASGPAIANSLLFGKMNNGGGANNNKLGIGMEPTAHALEVNGSGYFVGNVGIGTNAPAYALHVNGSVAGTSAYNNLSDQRLKKNVHVVENSLMKILEIQGVTYDWKKSEYPQYNLPSKTELGVIAQNVEAVFPEAVSEDHDGIKRVAYSMLIAPLIEAVRELKNFFDQVAETQSEQASRIQQLEAENANLKHRLDLIEQRLGQSSQD